MSEHYVTLFMKTKHGGGQLAREFIACVATMQDASWLLCTAGDGKARKVADMILGNHDIGSAAFDIDFGCKDTRFGDVWSRIQLRHANADGTTAVWKFLGQGGFGGAFAATLQCQPHPVRASEWRELRHYQMPNAPAHVDPTMRCAIKIPITYVQMLTDKYPHGVISPPVTQDDVKRAEAASNSSDVSEMREVMLDEIKVMHTLLFGVKHADMGEMRPDTYFKLDVQQFRDASDEAHRRACTEGHRFLNHLLEYSTGSIPCTVCTLRQGDLCRHAQLNPFWGTFGLGVAGGRSPFACACYQVYHGIRYMHSVNWVHMDIKPDNILYDIHPDGYVLCYLSDFGLACPLDEPLRSFRGTPLFGAPEMKMARVHPVVNTGACDAHSFALTMIALLMHSSYISTTSTGVATEVWHCAHRFLDTSNSADLVIRTDINAGNREDRDVLITLMDILASDRDPSTRANLFYVELPKKLERYRLEQSGDSIPGFSYEPAKITRGIGEAPRTPSSGGSSSSSPTDTNNDHDMLMSMQVNQRDVTSVPTWPESSRTIAMETW